MERWSIFIDIEGFSRSYNDSQAIRSLCALMKAIYFLGNKCFPESPDRIFAHQVGDGFVIVGEFGVKKIDVPLGIAMFLMRQVLLAGGVAKAAISEGDFADIRGCYPDFIEEEYDERGVIRLGRGRMTIFPVMGTALINSYKVLSASPSGALLIIENRNIGRLPDGLQYFEIFDSDLLVIDWLHSCFESLDSISKKAELPLADTSEMERSIKEYIVKNVLSQKWKRNTMKSLNIYDCTET